MSVYICVWFLNIIPSTPKDEITVIDVPTTDIPTAIPTDIPTDIRHGDENKTELIFAYVVRTRLLFLYFQSNQLNFK